MVVTCLAVDIDSYGLFLPEQVVIVTSLSEVDVDG